MQSPYTQVHDQFRATVRAFCERELAPHVAEWERDELFPNWVFKRASELDPRCALPRGRLARAAITGLASPRAKSCRGA